MLLHHLYAAAASESVPMCAWWCPNCRCSSPPRLVLSKSSSESSTCNEVEECGKTRWNSCKAEKALHSLHLSCLAANASRVCTLSASSTRLPMRGADGVALVEAEMEEEEEEEAPASVWSAVHPEDPKYSGVGTESIAAWSASQ